MESLLAGENTDFLIDGLNFKVGQNQASYIETKREATFFSPIDAASPDQVRVVKWNLAAPDAFIDLSTLCMSFELQNTGSHPLTFLSSSTSSLFSRVTFRVSSALAEDLQYYNRTTEMLLRCTPYQYRLNQTVGEFDPAGGSFEGNDFTASAIPSTEKRQSSKRAKFMG